jgi:hypothetical protein
MTGAGLKAIAGEEEAFSHVPAASTFTDEQMLRNRLKTATPCHFSDGPARLYRGRAVITRRWRVMRSDTTHISGNTSQDPMS